MKELVSHFRRSPQATIGEKLSPFVVVLLLSLARLLLATAGTAAPGTQCWAAA